MINWKKLIVALAINAGVLLVFVLMFNPVEKTDDFSMKAILDGAFGAGISAHLLYTNFLLGAVLKVLQGLAPVIPWFEVANYLTIFVSFTVITYIVFSFKNIKRSILLLLPILTFWGFEGYIKLTFTKTAGIALTCGLFLLFVGLKDKKKSDVIIGSLLALVGSMFRYKIFYSIFPIMIGIIIIEIILKIVESEDKKIKNAVKIILSYLIPAAVIFIFVFSVNLIGTKLFRASEEWDHYKEYNTLKADLQDYGWPDYYEFLEQYNELGISRNDYELWVDRDYGDPDVLNNELLAEIVSLKDNSGIKKYTENILNFFREYPVNFIQVNVFFGAVFIAIMLLFSKKKPLNWLKMAYPLVMVMLLEYYMFCNGRYGQHHVEVGIWLAVTMFYIYFMYDNDFGRYSYSVLGALAMVLIIFSVKDDFNYITTETYYGNSFTLSQEEARSVMDIITSDKGNLYILSNDEYYGLMRAYGTFESIPAGRLDNIFVLSAYNYPSHNGVLKAYGYENIYNNMNAPNVYYITSSGTGNAELIKQYVFEHYNQYLNYWLVNSIGSVNIYKFN